MSKYNNLNLNNKYESHTLAVQSPTVKKFFGKNGFL